MKKINITVIIIFLVLAGFCNKIQAQERSPDQERKEELLRAVEEQKRALEKQEKELRRNFPEHSDSDSGDDSDDAAVVRRGSRTYSVPRHFSIPGIPVMPDLPEIPMNIYFNDNNQRTSFEFTKSVKDDSFKREYSFDVDETAKSVTMAVSGDCKEGEIRIKILTPQGKTYSDVVIDNYGNMNVRKSFNISESENQDKTGEWKFQINADKASGYFRLSFQTF